MRERAGGVKAEVALAEDDEEEEEEEEFWERARGRGRVREALVWEEMGGKLERRGRSSFNNEILRPSAS